MSSVKEALFSLELVIEKLYVPYETCRFPAVAFRLLDFPTILISHVETELADNIRCKIKTDPYYQVPNQFTELQDKHGNFMMKKGKSCLFKTSINTLAMHLANTPLYIMVIDEYPEVPKLLGNSSLALNEIMMSIQSDMKLNGPTVPSVHGDKGLFKIFSLMGKEIGYLILGFRLLSLGPGLIAHLPDSAFVKRASEVKVLNEVDQTNVPVISGQVKDEGASKKSYVSIQDVANTTKEMGSMTEVEKHDVLMQTVEIEENKIHVAVSEKPKETKTMHTQTSLRPKSKPVTMVTTVDNFMKVGSDDGESDNDLLIKPNITCPPPLYYNSKAQPLVEIERDGLTFSNYESSYSDLTIEDMSGDEVEHSVIKQIKPTNKLKPDIPTRKNTDIPRIQDPHTVVLSNIMNAGIKTPVSSEPVFPLLNALLTELSKIQNPQLVQQAIGQIPSTVQTVPTVVAKEIVVAASERKELSVVKEEENVAVKKERRSYRTPARPAEIIPKNKGWMRKAPEVGVKKTKLVFGLTNTQRLRLAKGNPAWLKSAEHDEQVAKAHRKRPANMRAKEDQENETGNLSDTYTEMRRLAAAELEKTTMTETSIQTEMKSQRKKLKKKLPKSRDNSPAKRKHSRVRSKSPKGKKAFKADISGKESPSLNTSEQKSDLAADQPDSVAESVPSSRIEVRIPRVQAYESDDSEETISDDEYSDSSRKDTRSKFPGFHKEDDTLESIDGDANRSLSVTHDEDSPLESTRMSKQFRPGLQPPGESLFRSTDDYDTKQFHSTDEPELQDLISEEEHFKSEIHVPQRSAQSPTAAVAGMSNNARLSMKFEVVNPTASKNSPLPPLRRSQIKLDSLNAPPTPTDTPRSRSSQGSSKQPSPRPRKPVRERKLEFKRDSIHTESVSSYMPSESENILSLLSDGSYSDDFHVSSEKDASSRLSTPDFPKLIPTSKLGYTF